MQEMLVLGKNALRNCPRGMATLPPCPLTPTPQPGWEGQDLHTSPTSRSTSGSLSQPPHPAQEAGASPTEQRGKGTTWFGKGSRLNEERKCQGHCLTPGLQFCLQLPVVCVYCGFFLSTLIPPFTSLSSLLPCTP